MTHKLTHRTFFGPIRPPRRRDGRKNAPRASAAAARVAKRMKMITTWRVSIIRKRGELLGFAEGAARGGSCRHGSIQSRRSAEKAACRSIHS